MQLRGLLLLGVLLGAEATQVVRRQDSAVSSAPAGDSSSGDSGSSSEAVISTTAPPPDISTTAPPPPSDTSTDVITDTGSGGDITTSTAAEGDTTVTQTTTVTDGNVGTVSQKTTVMTTITSTILVTVTDFETTTVTSRDAATATKTVYETSTEWANMKRAINLAPRTVGPEDFEVEASATAVPTVTQITWEDLELVRHRRRGNLNKRATITEFVTVTVGKDSKATVVNTLTRTVISTVSDETTTTSTVTETEQADAKTTVTTTSTLTVTSTAVTTGVVRTETVAPSGSYGPAGTGGATSDSNSDNGGGASSGLSTGAKAGIGAGCGVVGLALIGALLCFCLKRRRSGPKLDADDMFGSSEVPVGPSGTDNHTPMSQQNRDTAANIITPRRIPTKPSSPEGYRGTAPGDGRAGFAKPQTFGSAYTNTTASPETQYSRTTDAHPDAVEMQSPANTAELGNDGNTGRWHDSNAAEIDGNQVAPHGSDPVYEMPAQNYK
ncbi:Fc.00g028640.m01.CDS01 [Cosmosporella sp. VM-42]